MRQLVIGDIHGRYYALRNVLRTANFDIEKDCLIFLGDICDNFYTAHVVDCIEYLMTIKNFTWVLGNHDEWLRRWFRDEWNEYEIHLWLGQGGYATRREYLKREDLTRDEELIQRHLAFMNKVTCLYHVDKDHNFYVHGGINWNYPPDAQPIAETYYWDRDTYLYDAWNHHREGTEFPYRTVFVGHTALRGGKPEKWANLWNIDTGAGNGNFLTIMDTTTYEYWQDATIEPETRLLGD